MNQRVFAVLFALVWFVNGLLCKLLGLAPRHAEIVARILGDTHAAALTRLIGAGEIVLGLWILSRRHWRWSAAVQIALVLTMNVIEFLLAPDLLLFGRWNALVALAYALLVAYAGFVARPASAPRPHP